MKTAAPYVVTRRQTLPVSLLFLFCFVAGMTIGLAIGVFAPLYGSFAYRPYRGLASYSGSRRSSCPKTVRVLCWILISPERLHSRGEVVRKTWGKRCNQLLFMSSKPDIKFPVISLDVEEGKAHLWQKTRAAWKYVYQHHISDADYYLKADDDTYVIVENLRYFVSQFNASEPYYWGRRFKTLGGFNSGGAGYVISRGALQRVGPVLDDREKCSHNPNDSLEDVEFSRCLRNVGIEPSDSRHAGRERFHPFAPQLHLVPGRVAENSWYWKYVYYPTHHGLYCCSNISISFHRVTSDDMYMFEFFVYHLRPHRVSCGGHGTI